MFRPTTPQMSLFQTSNLLPDDKRQKLEQDWPGQFNTHALPLIDERQFRDLYCENNGRPNKPVRIVLGVLVLKEMFDCTDLEALGELAYDLRWQVALGLTPEDAHCCQKTLHNFRAKLLDNDKAKQLFIAMTDKMLKALGLSADRQRLDSTHIISNIACLTRLGLFCETIRNFLRALKKCSPEKFATVPVSQSRRYLKEDGHDTYYHDPQNTETQRRLKVCARDIYRLIVSFKSDQAVQELSAYQILTRLFSEQCEVNEQASPPEADDADSKDPLVPVQLKESKTVSSASLQSPHDTDVTYSGHKGKGYEVQIAETVGNGEKPELITYVEVTPACGSDETATVPALIALIGRDIQPRELTTDTNYASAANVIECEKRGTEIVAPVRGPAAEIPKENEKTLADFQVVVKEEKKPVLCPAGHEAESTERKECGSIKATFEAAHCGQCPFATSCPTKQNSDGVRTLKTTLTNYVLAIRRRYEQTEEFQRRYADRSGIEATNSEIKRAHGMGFLRVRGGLRVKLSVYFKVLACNIKRMVRYLAEQGKKAAQIAAISSKIAMAPIFDSSAHFCAIRNIFFGEKVFQSAKFFRVLAA